MLGFDLTDEQRELKELAHRFAEQEIIPRAREYDEKEIFPVDVCEKAFAAGLMNFGVPKELGGPGLGVLDTSLIVEELNYGCSGISNAVGANDLATLPILIAGNDEQKRTYLGQLVKKLTFCAFAITEPGAGSDVAAMSTAYRREGDEFILNGTKHFISNGSRADWYVTFATSDKRLKHKGISCFVFPSSVPGITRNRMHGKLGQRAADTGEIFYEDVRIPASALVGREGEGFKYAMATFDHSRPEIGAIAIGIAQRALDECLKYSKQRSAFGQPIANFQAIQFMMADMAIEIEAMRLLTYKAAWLVDRGQQRQHDFGLREGIQRRRDDADHDRRRADFRRLWLHEGLSGGEADARREAAADLRGHVADPARRDRAQPAQGVSARRARGQFAGATGCGIGGSWPAGSLPVTAPTYSPSWYTSTWPVVGSGNRFHSSGGGASEGGTYTTGAGAGGAGGAAEHEAIAIDNSRGNAAREILLFMMRR